MACGDGRPFAPFNFMQAHVCRYFSMEAPSHHLYFMHVCRYSSPWKPLHTCYTLCKRTFAGTPPWKPLRTASCEAAPRSCTTRPEYRVESIEYIVQSIEYKLLLAAVQRGLTPSRQLNNVWHNSTNTALALYTSYSLYFDEHCAPRSSSKERSLQEVTEREALGVRIKYNVERR